MLKLSQWVGFDIIMVRGMFKPIESTFFALLTNGGPIWYITALVCWPISIAQDQVKVELSITKQLSVYHEFDPIQHLPEFEYRISFTQKLNCSSVYAKTLS